MANIAYGTGTLPYVGYGVTAFQKPVPGYLEAPFFLDWSMTSASMPGFDIGPFDQFPNMPKQIACLYVDNSQCHQVINIIFSDTQTKYIIPPFTRGYYPVLTRGTKFSVTINEPGSTAANDSTVIYAQNYMTPPAENPVLFQANVYTPQTVDPSASIGDTVVIGGDRWTKFNGAYVSIVGAIATGAGFTGEFIIDDILEADFTLPANGSSGTFILYSQTGLEIPRFGMNWHWTVTAGALATHGVMDVNIFASALPPPV